MKTLLTSFRAEWLRLVHSRGTWMAAFAVLLVAFFRVALERFRDQARWAERVRTAILQGSTPPEAPEVGNAFGPWVDGLGTGVALGAILLVVHSARSLAADDERGIARIQLTRGGSRLSGVLSRTLLGGLLSPLVILLAGLGSGLAALLFFEFGPLIVDGYELASVETITGELVLAVIATWPPLFASYVFGLALSAWARTSALALVVTLIALLGFDLFKEVLGTAQYWIFAAYTPSFVDRSCLGEMSGIARGQFDAGYTESLMRMNFLIPSCQVLLFFVVTLLLYRRRAL